MKVPDDLVDASHEFLTAVRCGEESEQFVTTFADAAESELPIGHESPDAATAFWVNLYNGFVQVHLDADPSIYEDRRRFFGEARITVAGKRLSLDDIEHGLLRSSKWKYGLGYVPRLFPNGFETRYRLPTVDPRVHFALNCGAESCPPIAAYTPEGIDMEMDTSTRSFLDQSCEYEDAETLRVSRLFFYYRGDFGGRSGIYEFLERYGVLEAGERPSVRYKPYDWTLHTGMYRSD